MNWFCWVRLLSSLCIHLSCGLVESKLQTRLIYGREAQLFEHPYQAAVVSNTKNFFLICNGVLISPNQFMTLSFCLVHDTASQLKVILGWDSVNGPANSFQQTLRVTRNKLPNKNEIKDGIAVLTLATNVRLNKNIQIPRVDTWSSYINTSCVTIGLGQTNADDPQMLSTLQTASLYVISKEECISRWPAEAYYLRNPRYICAYDRFGRPEGQKAVCANDEGAPLLCGQQKNVLIGLLLLQPQNCDGDQLSIYLSMHDYKKWL
ncbi:fibrinolytic enzyme isozyme C [Biomphalaria pfeifferi]|uniref:Fibrinolytic enzyme isozyme C n=1 Tax=Biomphalaria pfeifferi TaxID=112525 RepID=A0AAD8FLZ9_BIOPF|nr:fibrinolytic enzyme isozyme C [Biomphalaria pfeifferi]